MPDRAVSDLPGSIVRMITKLPPPTRGLSADQARRIAIAAQQLDEPAPVDRATPVNRGHLSRLVRSIGLLQIDSVNVLARSHLIPVFSRLGSYPVPVLESLAWPARSADRGLLESWAHVASLIPTSLQPLLRWRQERLRAEMEPRAGRLRREHPGLFDRLVQLLAERGPMSAGEIETALQVPGAGGGAWWGWSTTKSVCEYLFLVGEIGVADRRGFERRYDVIERIVPPSVLAAPTPTPSDAQRALVDHAARAHGIGTVGDLADYFRIGVAHTRAALADLAEEGVVAPVAVDGWREPAFLHRDARIPRTVRGSALICPFDPLIWYRQRTERLFGMRFRIEIYTPAPKRVHGYYVLPLLSGDRLVGRFDLKADRAESRLLVQASWHEPGEDPARVARDAAPELRRMADWLGLDDVVVRPRGDAHRELGRAPGMTAARDAVPAR